MNPAFARRLVIFATFLAACLGGSPASSQNPSQSTSKGAGVVEFLTETIGWYRGIAVEQQIANEPGDVTFLNENRRISDGIVRLAFDFARLAEKSESAQSKGGRAQEQADTSSPYQRLTQAVAKADQQVEQSQNELQSLRQKMATAPAGKRTALESQIGVTQSELAFRQARRDVLRDILQFTAGTGTGSADLRAQVEELARSVPAALTGAEDPSPERPVTGSPAEGIQSSMNRQQASGIWGLGAD